MKKKLLLFLKKYYKIISLIIILTSGGVTIFQFNNEIEIIKSFEDQHNWDPYLSATKVREIVKSNDSLFYWKIDMSLFSGTIDKTYHSSLPINGMSPVQLKSYKREMGFYKTNFSKSDYLRNFTRRMQYLKGKRHGIYALKYDRFSDTDFVYKNYYKNGAKTGKWEYWLSLQLIERVFYENDLKQGEWKEWDNGGNLIKHWIMKDDIPIEKIVN